MKWRTMFAVAMLAGLEVATMQCDAAPRKSAKTKPEAGKMDGCFKGSDLDLGIPDDAVFFLAEVSVEGEAMANRRWFVGPGGEVRFGKNALPFDFDDLPRKPFNRPFGNLPVAKVPGAEIESFVLWLEAEGFFRLPAEVGPPDGLRVQGGVDRWVVARHAGTTACIRLRPGAPLSDAVKSRFMSLIEAHRN